MDDMPSTIDLDESDQLKLENFILKRQIIMTRLTQIERQFHIHQKDEQAFHEQLGQKYRIDLESYSPAKDCKTLTKIPQTKESLHD